MKYALPLVAICGSLSAQHWTLLPGHINNVGDAVAYDSARDRVVLFGGSYLHDETWLLNGNSWSLVSQGGGPVGRYTHAMAYDMVRNRTVMFGGTAYLGMGVLLGDTWEWNGATWQPQFSVHSPSPRTAHSLAFDAARGEVLLFGGYHPTSGPLSETWAWNGVDWSQKFPLHVPPSRQAAGMAYCSRSGCIVLFGGADQSARLADTWDWNGADWQAATLTQPTPSARAGAVLATSPRQGNVLLFGGYSAVGTLHDSWEWDGSAWSQLSPNLSPTGDRGKACLDTLRQRTVFVFDDQTAWEFRVPTATVTPYGQGCAGVTTALQPHPGSLPLIGQAFTSEVLVMPVGATFAFADYGTSRTSVGPFPLPLALDGFGMPGCHLFHDALLLQIMQINGNTATHQLVLPTAITLEGLHLFVQALISAPGANPAELVATNALDLTLGNQ